MNNIQVSKWVASNINQRCTVKRLFTRIVSTKSRRAQRSCWTSVLQWYLPIISQSYDATMVYRAALGNNWDMWPSAFTQKRVKLQDVDNFNKAHPFNTHGQFQWYQHSVKMTYPMASAAELAPCCAQFQSLQLQNIIPERWATRRLGWALTDSAALMQDWPEKTS